jgi:hypothetical protein
MANKQSGGIHHAAQVVGDSGLHQLHYADFLRLTAAMRALNGKSDTVDPDETMDAALDRANAAFDDLIECPAVSLASILLKVKAGQLQAFNTMEGSCVSPRVYGELLGIIAADLEVVMLLPPEARGEIVLLHPVGGGKAMLS